MDSIYDTINNLWVIIPQDKINKTQVLYKGKNEHLLQLKKSLSHIKSSDVYPAMDKYYDFSMFFYSTDSKDLETLKSKCEEILFADDIKESSTSKNKPNIIIGILLFLIILAGSFIGKKAYEKYEQKKIKKTEQTVENIKTEKSEDENNNKEEQKLNNETLFENKDKSESNKKDNDDEFKLIKNSDLMVKKRRRRKSNLVTSKKYLKVYFFDIGQADCEIIMTPDKKCYVIDSGKRSSDGKKIYNFLKKKRVKVIQQLILTHPHQDHIGGALYLLKKLKVKEVLDSGKSYSTNTYRRILNEIKKNRKIKYKIPKRFQQLKWGKYVKVNVLHPKSNMSYDNTNNYSIVLQVIYNKIKILFTGDAEKEVEYEMVNDFRKRLRSDVLKVGHHCSRTSNTKKFLDYVKPRYAVIEVGKHNRYHHPNMTTYKRLKNYCKKIYRTDENGMVTLTTNGYKVKLKSER